MFKIDNKTNLHPIDIRKNFSDPIQDIEIIEECFNLRDDCDNYIFVSLRASSTGTPSSSLFGLELIIDHQDYLAFELKFNLVGEGVTSDTFNGSLRLASHDDLLFLYRDDSPKVLTFAICSFRKHFNRKIKECVANSFL